MCQVLLTIPEGALAKQHLDFLSTIPHDKELIIFDRGYPSVELISFIESKNFYYLIKIVKLLLQGKVRL